MHIPFNKPYLTGRETACEQVLRLPFFNAMTRTEQDAVIGEVLAFYGA